MQVKMEAGDLVMMHGPARYEWKHGIPAVSNDQWHDGTVTRRGERISMTFRALLPSDKDEANSGV